MRPCAAIAKYGLWVVSAIAEYGLWVVSAIAEYGPWVVSAIAEYGPWVVQLCPSEHPGRFAEMLKVPPPPTHHLLYSLLFAHTHRSKQ